MAPGTGRAAAPVLRLDSQAADVDGTLRQWAARARQMVASLGDTRGHALEMLATFSDM